MATSCHVFWAQNPLKNDPKIPILKRPETTLLRSENDIRSTDQSQSK